MLPNPYFIAIGSRCSTTNQGLGNVTGGFFLMGLQLRTQIAFRGIRANFLAHSLPFLLYINYMISLAYSARPKADPLRSDAFHRPRRLFWLRQS